MARLNEPPPASAECFETLRRKFLRQNREIAKLNSKQSQRIRELEADYARVLSDNLDLSGQVWRLQKELESNAAQRTADHALEVKAKLEAQLAEMNSLIAGLGVEPPTKRRSPGRKTAAPAKHGLARSPRQKRLRDVAKDSEELAMQEGRLPPIQENRRYPRESMNSDEIKALCYDAADITDSPDLGPPPVSRFVDEDPVKPESPMQPVGHDSKVKLAADEPRRHAEVTPPLPKLDFAKKPALENVAKQATEAPSSVIKAARVAQEAPASPAPNSLRPGSKRKYGDENEIVKTAIKSPEKATPVEVGVENRGNFPELHKQRSIKSLSSSGRPQKGKTQRPVAVPSNPRRALAAKSTNEDIASPRKQPKDVKADDLKAVKPLGLRGEVPKERPTQKKTPTVVKVPDSPALPITIPIVQPETPFSDNPLLAPGTPDHSVPRDVARDTPPPADISAMGETSRPSRRVRAAISYAEPNLRDKMRRPTKELVDAVCGEGKPIHKSAQKTEGQGSASGSLVIRESSVSSGGTSLSAAELVAKESARRQSVLSPLAAKESAAETLPSTVVTGRRKRMSSMGGRESLAPMDKSGSSRDAPTQEADSSGDIYDFTTSSPTSETKDARDNAESSSMTAQHTSRSRGSAAAAKDNSTSPSDLFAPAKPTRGRKRTSMIAPKKGSLLDPDEPYESNGDDEGTSVRSRVSRRKSMML